LGRWYDVYAFRIGEPERRRVAILFNDITGRKRVEEALRESEERFRGFAENSADVLWIADANTAQLEYLSPAFEPMWGQARDEVMGNVERWIDLVHPEDRERALGAMPRLLLGETVSIDYRIVRPDGGLRWIRDVGFPIRDENGAIRRVAGVAQEITKDKQAEERQMLLLAELQHRVRNILAVVRSIARRTSETSKTVADYAAHLDGRLNALARTQAMVTRNPAAGVDLEYLVAEELIAHGGHEGEQVQISGPKVRLRPKAAETFGLAMHELATNATKYGALTKPDGRIDVRWRVDRDGDGSKMRLDWMETGASGLPAKPRRKGFGAELLERTLAYELGATTSLTFASDGCRCTIDLPLTDRVAILEDVANPELR
jgi:PAS domain S-box-containing protein